VCLMALVMLATLGGHQARMAIIMGVLTPPIFVVGKSIIAAIYLHYWITTGLKKFGLTICTLTVIFFGVRTYSTPIEASVFFAMMTSAGLLLGVLGHEHSTASTLPGFTALLVVASLSGLLARDRIFAAGTIATGASTLILWWGSTRHNRAVVKSALFTTLAIIAIIGLVQAVGELVRGVSIYDLQRPTSVFPNTNNLAAAMIPALALALLEKRWHWFAVFALVLLLTGSRSALAGAIAGTIFYVIPYALTNKKKLLQGGALAAGGAVLLLPFMISRTVNSTHGTLALRFDLWQVGLLAFNEQPLIGVGPGNYRSAFIRFAVQDHEQIHVQAHSLPIQVAAELGIAGLIVLVGLICLVAFQCLKIYQSNKQVGVIGIALFAALAVHSLFDYVYGLSGNLLILLVSGWSIFQSSKTNIKPQDWY
jgi:O-antigen ligase